MGTALALGRIDGGGGAATRYVDLGLPADKPPADPPESARGVSTFSDGVGDAWRCYFDTPELGKRRRGSGAGDAPKHLRTEPEPKESADFTPAIGTRETIYATDKDTGLFGTVFDAWSNHWDLKTSPEDWWMPVITKVATAINDNADRQGVRNLFVNGRQTKERLVVNMPSFSIYDTDYSSLFDGFSTAINGSIGVPGYVETITSAFSTTSPTMRISSQITTMKGFQKYFDYEMGICGCGIHGLEMLGAEEDWILLKTKLAALRSHLAPIERDLRLDGFFEVADEVFKNLHLTFVAKKKNKKMQKWWSNVLIQGKDYEYGPSGMRKTEVDAYNGWLVEFLIGNRGAGLKAKELARGEYAKELSGLTSCMVHVVDRVRDIKDDSIVVAGMLGYSIHPAVEGRPTTLQPAHGWCMLLPPSSALRSE